MGASGVNMPGMDKLAKAMSAVDGLPVLTEMTMTVNGPAGDQRVDMMRQVMGDMKVTTKVMSVKTDAIAEEAFKIPEGYQVVK
jgi:hypothetical protein